MFSSGPSFLPPESLPASLGRYQLKQLVGRGATGAVYRAVLHGPAGFRKRLAVKLIPALSEQEVAFEARLGAMLDHDNIVEVYDLARVEPWWLIAMEWVEGHTLRELMEQRGAPPGRVIQQIGAQLAMALAHAHGLVVDDQLQPVVHRDLKPSNVLLTKRGLVKLADFGVATLAGVAFPRTAGTFGYMAPEQISPTSVVDPRTDQFALGIVLAEMALGRRMVLGKTAEQVQQRHAQITAALAMGELQRSIDEALPGLGPLVAQCLAHDVEARFGDCLSLASALSGLVATGPSFADWMTEATSDRDLAVGPATNSTNSGSHGSGSHPGGGTLFGRDADLGILARALETSRLVMVQGPGGVGKSALVRRHAVLMDRNYEGAPTFAELSSARDVQGVCSAVAAALGHPLGSGDQAEVVRQVGHQLRGLGSALLLLDNADQVLESAHEVLEVWLDIATEARFVVTSRTGFAKEAQATVVRIAPLASTDAVALLRDRAARAGGLDAWGATEAQPVLAELAKKLDFLPLALELAAARARSLEPSEMLSRLAERFQLLGQSDERHGALETVVRASWDQLSAEAQRSVAELSVFRGGFTIEDAERVVGTEAATPWLAEFIEKLLDASLLVAQRTGERGRPRFRLYESVRLYASRTLDDVEAVRLRHARWFARMGGPSNLLSPPRDPLRARQARDLDNFVAGIEAGLRFGDRTAAAGCAVAAGRVILHRGPMRHGLTIVERVLAVEPEHPALLDVAAQLALQAGDARANLWAERAYELAKDARLRVATARSYGRVLRLKERPAEAMEILEEARVLAANTGDPVLEGWVALSLGRVHADDGDEARGHLGYALSRGRLAGHQELIVLALVMLGGVGLLHDDLDGAKRRLDQALEAGRGMRRREAEVHGLLGQWAKMSGQIEVARQHQSTALHIHGEMGVRRLQVHTLSALGVLDTLQLNFAGARDRFEAGLSIAVEVEEWSGATSAAGNLAGALTRMGEINEALRVHQRLQAFGAETRDATTVARLDANRSGLALEQDDFRWALRLAEGAAKRVRDLGPPGRQARVITASGVAAAQSALGQYDRAADTALRALAEGTNRANVAAGVHLEAGWAAAFLGNDTDMRHHFERASILAHEANDVWLSHIIVLRQAEIRWLLQDATQAASRLDEVLSDMPASMKGYVIYARAMRIQAGRWLGQTGYDAAEVSRAIEELEGLGMRYRARLLREAPSIGAETR
ncbi:MAG: protein kinase [Myxococcota bacterium]